ncbi:hypothetical protein PG990_011016 [Apiospora arundinis]
MDSPVGSILGKTLRELVDAKISKLTKDREVVNAEKQRLAYTSLHAKLIKEWTCPDVLDPDLAESEEEQTRSRKTEDEARKQRHRRQWEALAFTTPDANAAKLQEFLEDVFFHEKNGGNRIARALKDLSSSIKEFEKQLAQPNQITATTLKWVISDLLDRGYTSTRNCEALEEIGDSQTVLREISDLLESQMKDIQNWSWGDSVTLLYRQGPNKKHAFDMDNSILHVILLHYIGVKWPVFFKKLLSSLMPDTDTHGPENSCDDGGTKSSLLHLRHKVYQESYLVCTLIDQEPFSVYQGKKRSTKPKSSFLQIVSTEVSIKMRLHGQLDMLHSKFPKLVRRLPHYTIYNIFSFLGVSETWLKFFLTFLRPPLRFHPDLGSSKTQLRNRGIPFRFVLSAVFEEVVLFCLDLAVNQATDGGLLYRRSGDQLFWSPSESHIKHAWEAIQTFAAVTGILVEGGFVRLGDPKRCSSPYCR